MTLKSKILLSIISGVLLSLAWPANGLPYLAFIALVPLFYLEDSISKDSKKPLQKIWLYSYMALFTWNLLTTWWIWNSTAFGAVMAIVLNSLFMSWVWVIYSWSKKHFYNNRNAIFLFPIYWIAFEYLHMDWDLSWSWLNLGNVFANHIYAVQWYESTGSLGGSWWIILINILVFRWWKKIEEYQFKPEVILWASIIPLIFAVGPILYSLYIYNNYQEAGEDIEVVVVQPNMDPWSEQFLSPPEEVINRMIQLSKPLISDKTKFWVAPESAIQEGLKEPEMTSRFGKSISVNKLRNYMATYPDLQMIVGASTWNYLDKETPTHRKTSDGKMYDEYNTAVLLNSGQITDTYHKSKLVPGPEKMPFKKLLSPIQNVAFDLGGTVGSLGYDDERKVFYSKDGKTGAAPLICYESIYGGFVAEFVRNGANLLMVITNDGWWGNTAGHKQHLAYARLRAVECRRAVARSANTGVSGFVNQRGDLIETTPYWVQDARKAIIKANDQITFFVQYGDYPGRTSAFLAVLLLLISITVYFKKDKN